MKTLIAILLIVHGLISAGFSIGCFKPGAMVPNPAWLGSWPTSMGQSWLLARLGWEQSPITILFGILFLSSGLALAGAGLGLLEFMVPAALVPKLALIGAGLCFFMLIVYLHPFYLIGFVANGVVLIFGVMVHMPSLLTPGLKVIESVQMML